MMLAGKRLARYEIMMKRASDKAFGFSVDFLCKGCPHHRPNWKYRFCEFPECPQMKGMQTFWEEGVKNGKQ